MQERVEAFLFFNASYIIIHIHAYACMYETSAWPVEGAESHVPLIRLSNLHAYRQA